MSQLEILEKADATMGEVPAPLVLLQMLSGMMATRALQVAAQFGIADLLADGPKHIDELAAATRTHAPSLYRLLRMLASNGIFAEDSPRSFTQTKLSHFLRADVYGSMRDMARMWGADWRWATWGDLAYSVQTGRPAFDHIHHKDLWEHFASDDAAAGRLFSMAMTSFSEAINHPVAAAYDFSALHTLLDIGGAHGSTLAEILQANPGLQGILFDVPTVIAGAAEPLRAAGVAARCRLEAGDFFTSVPEGADAHIMKMILHDWNDEQCGQILRNCRRSIAPGGQLLVVEQLVPPGNEPSFSKLMDLEMLAVLTGRERTEAEFAALFSAAGFTLTRVLPTASPFCIIEGIAS